MAINMKDVKAITIPDGSVKKIEDANGNIIWGSVTAFPYRKLEYIKFSGAEYIQTDFYGGTININHQCEFSNTNTSTFERQQLLIGLYDNSVTNNLRRFYPILINNSGIDCCVGSTWSSYATSFSANDKLKFSLTYNKDSSDHPRFYWYLINQTNSGVTIGTAAPLVENTVGDLNTTLALRLGCQRTGPTNDRNENYWVGNVYNYQRRQNNSSGTLLTNYIPCQRKSDNVCGVYDTISQTFIPMQGTNITTSAAGSIVDEYWDLTA